MADLQYTIEALQQELDRMNSHVTQAAISLYFILFFLFFFFVGLLLFQGF